MESGNTGKEVIWSPPSTGVRRRKTCIEERQERNNEII